ncbi:MAG: proline dehydrogenase family protein [Fidelibacterota bacterium]
MAWFNQALVSSLPVFPKFLVSRMAMRYVAGESLQEAIQTVSDLNRRGFSATLDILGENTTSRAKAEAITRRYLRVYDAIQREGLDSTVSLKLTHLGLGYEDSLAEKCLMEILEKAKRHNNFLRIDMEDSPYTDRTLNLYRRCLKRYSQVGPVLQAYLKRSGDDLSSLVGKELNVRICKGIYNESPGIAFKDRQDIRDNFIRLVQTALEAESTVGIATHDLYLIDSLETWIRNRNIPRDKYEFQVLYGVPVGHKLASLLTRKHRVRVYVPFGEEWYRYATRRLKENPRIARYVLKNLTRRK